MLYDWRREAEDDIRSMNVSQGAFAAAAEKQMTAAERRLSAVGEATDEMARNLESTVTEVYKKGGSMIQSQRVYSHFKMSAHTIPSVNRLSHSWPSRRGRSCNRRSAKWRRT